MADVDGENADDGDEIEAEPQITSDDPQERKLARKLRIERRLENMRKQNMPEGEDEVVEMEKSLLQQQMQKSDEVLEQLILDADEYVTNVRVANDGREADRREEEGIGREKIIEKLEEEATASEEMFHEIADKWEGILKYHDPLHINEDMIAQKEKCDELIKQKDGIIAMLKEQLKTAEIKFSRDQRKQNEDIETLVKRIEKQLTLMRRAYRQELQLIENVIMFERQTLVENSNKRWEELYKKRNQEEEANCEAKLQQVEHFDEVMTKLRHDFQEKYREKKIKLENDIESLQQELGEIKALVLLNTEKLDYNFQILKKREDENIKIRSQQKRRINKLQDLINGLRKKICDYNSTSKTKQEKLTEEIKKMQKHVLDIERTADLFQKNNGSKYVQVWALNNTIADKHLKRILLSDKILNEQQLGMKWQPPEEKVLVKTDLPSYRKALQAIGQCDKKSAAADNAKQNESTSGRQTATITDRSNLSDVEETLAYRRLLRQILKHISDKSGFLIDSGIKQLLKPFVESDQTLVRVDTVFAALEVTKKQEIDVLVRFFMPYAHCPVCASAPSTSNAKESDMEIDLDFDNSSSEGSARLIEMKKSTIKTNMTEIMHAVRQPAEAITEIMSTVLDHPLPQRIVPEEQNVLEVTSKESIRSLSTNTKSVIKSAKKTATVSEHFICQFQHPLVISPVYVMKAMREFVSKFRRPEIEDPTMNMRLARSRHTICRLMESGDVKMFWERYRTIFDENRLQTWDGLYMGLQKYHGILKDREKIHDQVVKLRKEHVELRELLKTYLTKAKKNEPMKPPCAVQREIPIVKTPVDRRNRKL